LQLIKKQEKHESRIKLLDMAVVEREQIGKEEIWKEEITC
jgi:hypothetical protein